MFIVVVQLGTAVDVVAGRGPGVTGPGRRQGGQGVMGEGLRLQGRGRGAGGETYLMSCGSET